jgi:hypothetical protein
MVTNDINIIDVHNSFLQYFSDETEKLQYYKKKLDNMILTQKNLSYKNINLEQSILYEEKYIHNIENKINENMYISKTVKFINNYKKILNTPKKINFFKKKSKTSPKVSETDRIIIDYITIASMICDTLRKPHNIVIPPLTNQDTIDDNVKCKGVNCDNVFDFEDTDKYKICRVCGYKEELTLFVSSYKDVDRVNIISRYTYDRRIHFKECINQYQGKQNCNVEQSVLDALIKEFDNNFLLLPDTGEKYSRFKNITRGHVMTFLKELHFTKHYENSIYIHSLLTGEKPDDISHLESVLMNEFDEIVAMYDTLYDKNVIQRKNFISSQFILYQLLLKHKHKCKKSDFMLVKTTERKSIHIDITKRIFNELSFNFYDC